VALTQTEVVGILRQELKQAQGADFDELSANREKALEYFFNQRRGDEVPGRSQVQSSDVSDMVEAVLSNIAPILTQETLIQFEAAGEEDEKQAQIESDFVAYMVAGQNEGYVELVSAIKDALLLKNGFIKVWVEELNGTRSFTEHGLADFQIQSKLDEADAEHHFEIAGIDTTGSTSTVHWRELTHTRELKVDAIAPENLLYSPDHRTPYLRDCRFIAERKLLTKSDLMGMGYSKKQVKDLPAIDTDTTSAHSARRNSADADDNAADPANAMVETWDIHTLIDEKQTGLAELRHFHLASNEILLDELADWVPLATGSPFLIPHRLYGQSVYDKLRNVQDSKTDFLRQWHDNARRVNNARIAYNPMVTEEGDVLATRPGGGIRTRDPQGVVQIQTSDMGASIRTALDYMDKVRSERAGASLDLGSAELQLAAKNVGDQGVERQLSVKEQLAAMMTASLANTLIRETFLLVHMTLRAQMPGDLSAKLNGKWVQTNPSDWPVRKKVNVMTGLSRGEKTQRLQALTQVIQTQLGFMEKGQEGQIVDKPGVYQAITDWSRTAGLENVEQYWIDPSSEKAQQAAKAASASSQQAQEAQAAQMKQQQDFQESVFALQSQLDKYKHDSKLVFDYAKERLDAEIEEAKIIGTATLDLERQQLAFENAQQGQINGTGNGP
jgi:hypothetical protein